MIDVGGREGWVCMWVVPRDVEGDGHIRRFVLVLQKIEPNISTWSGGG